MTGRTELRLPQVSDGRDSAGRNGMLEGGTA